MASKSGGSSAAGSKPDSSAILVMESLPYGGDEIDTMAMSQWKMEDLAADLGKQPEPVAVPSAPVVPHPNLYFFLANSSHA